MQKKAVFEGLFGLDVEIACFGSRLDKSIKE